MRIWLAILTGLQIAQLSVSAQLPVIISHPVGRTVWNGVNVRFDVTISGTGPFTYQWQLDGTDIPNNIITTVAGGWIGDGAEATNANFYNPFGMAVDLSGNFLIA